MSKRVALAAIAGLVVAVTLTLAGGAYITINKRKRARNTTCDQDKKPFECPFASCTS